MTSKMTCVSLVTLSLGPIVCWSTERGLGSSHKKKKKRTLFFEELFLNIYMVPWMTCHFGISGLLRFVIFTSPPSFGLQINHPLFLGNLSPLFVSCFFRYQNFSVFPPLSSRPIFYTFTALTQFTLLGVAKEEGHGFGREADKSRVFFLLGFIYFQFCELKV